MGPQLFRQEGVKKVRRRFLEIQRLIQSILGAGRTGKSQEPFGSLIPRQNQAVRLANEQSLFFSRGQRCHD